ncbi:protein EXORDIUM-like 3 [Neltuma alba]|uniref:protein EXORDIUM-like 3 n=1 Tax=Neltuma alba TaxID=207710 RepID=UPI0010A4976A|nr:protein EXORDIUM-like 3 [Prosopis alba]
MTPASLTILLALALLLPTAKATSIAVERHVPPLAYNDGDILTSNINIAILWYGNVTTVQKNKILAFLKSINAKSAPQLNVNSWWRVVESDQTFARKIPSPMPVKVMAQKEDPSYSQGKVLIMALIPGLTGGNNNLLAFIVASDSVT